MELTWHGHSTWHVTVGDTDLLIDPFFGNPKTDVDPAAMDAPDAVLLTHAHADHVGDLDAFADATVVGTPEVASWITDEFGVEDTVGMNLGGTYELGDAFLTMHRADHTNGMQTDYEHGAGMPAGYLISNGRPGGLADDEATTFYHAGDTALMSEMKDVVGPLLEPDAAALPIGDHFTMGPEQAAIAVDWLDVDHAFPMHYDTMEIIEQDPQDFERAVRATGSTAKVHSLAGDESFEL